MLNRDLMSYGNNLQASTYRKFVQTIPKDDNDNIPEKK